MAKVRTAEEMLMIFPCMLEDGKVLLKEWVEEILKHAVEEGEMSKKAIAKIMEKI